jgi:lycopene cyclase domain-containing protein
VSYSTLAVIAVVGVLVVDLAVYRTRMVMRRAFWAAYAIIIVFQLLMNGVLTGLDVVTYDPDTVWGLRIAYAPVEDLLFGFALVTLTHRQAARPGHRHAPVEHPVVGPLDLGQDAAVERGRRPHAVPGLRRQQRRARGGVGVAAADDGDHLPHQRADVRVEPLLGQLLPGHPVRGHRVGGQVHPAAVDVLGDVAEEVGQLERLAERDGVRRGLLARHAGGGAQDRQHLQPDDRRRAPHVPVEGGEVGVGVDVEVAGHRGEEVDEVLDGDVVPAVGVHQRQADRVR